MNNNPQLTYKARRIFVGNLPPDPPVTEIMLREFFDQAMQQAGLTSGAGCCVSDVWISSEKNFAFIEVRTVLEASNAMTLDGIQLHGTPLRVNRPHDYVPPTDIIQPVGGAAPPIGGLPPPGLAGVAPGIPGMPGMGMGILPGMPGVPSILPGMPGMPGMPGIPGMPGMGMGILGMPGMGGLPGMPPAPPVNISTLMQMTKKSRRLHIGNLPIGVTLTPEMLKQFIGQTMQQLNLLVKPGNPVIDSFVSSDGAPPNHSQSHPRSLLPFIAIFSIPLAHSCIARLCAAMPICKTRCLSAHPDLTR
jgi:hypothetical protein